MHKRDYFIAALKAGCFRYKQWVLEAFSITRPRMDGKGRDFPYALHREADGRYFFDEVGNDSFLRENDKIYLEGTFKDEPAFHFRDELVIGVGELPNVRKNITTTYGNALFNQIALVWPFGNKIDYVEGRVSVPQIEKIIEARLVDRPALASEESPNDIYVDEYKRYNEAMFSLAGFTQLCVASATPRTMTTDPQVAIRRAELLEQFKDRLHDPVIQAQIDAELIAIDKAWMKGDPGEGFYLKDKSYSVVRKKLFLLQGAEQGFDVAGDVIPTSLNDGWNIENLPAMGNSLREGSYNRGALTAQGGEATKFNYRIFQNTRVVEFDCESTLGLEVVLTPANAKYYIASSVITPKGSVELTEENLAQFTGKSIRIRSPAFCRSGGASFCATCIGRKIATTPNAVATYAANIGSVFMSIMLKSMHGKSLSVAKFDLSQHLN